MPREQFDEAPLIQQLAEHIQADLKFQATSACRDHSLLSSGWQKSIRRGDAQEALRCALALHDLDPAYVWRRMRGIVLEEVSAADVDLVGQVIAIAGKGGLRKKLGERQLLASLTQRLAAAAKCRTACDLLMWVNAMSPSVAECSPLLEADRLCGASAPSLLLSAALWYATAPRSIRSTAGWQVVTRGDHCLRDAWMEAAELPSLVRYIVQRGGSTDGLNALLVPAYQLGLHQAWTVTEEPSSTASMMLIDGMPAYAYCLFSGPGRAALRRFLTEQPKWVSRLAALGVTDHLRALGHAVFQVEGGFCAQRFVVSRADEIRHLSELATLGRFGVHADAVAELQRRVLLALPVLNRARADVAGVRQPQKPA